MTTRAIPATEAALEILVDDLAGTPELDERFLYDAALDALDAERPALLVNERELAALRYLADRGHAVAIELLTIDEELLAGRATTTSPLDAKAPVETVDPTSAKLAEIAADNGVETDLLLAVGDEELGRILSLGEEDDGEIEVVSGEPADVAELEGELAEIRARAIAAGLDAAKLVLFDGEIWYRGAPLFLEDLPAPAPTAVAYHNAHGSYRTDLPTSAVGGLDLEGAARTLAARDLIGDARKVRVEVDPSGVFPYNVFDVDGGLLGVITLDRS